MNKGIVKFYNQHGEGVVFIDKKPFYVYGAILGEEIEFEIINELKTYGIGKLINVLKNSLNRVEHNIKNPELIGGYDLIHMNEEEQKKFKLNRVINDFKQIAKFELKNVEWFSGNKKIKYRNKITLHDGCFYQKNTNIPIDIDDFLLSDIKWDKSLKGDIIYRQLDTLIYGTKKEKKYTTDTLLGFKFRVGLNSFYQVNKEVTEFAYDYINNNIAKDSSVLDLYCGIGTIGIILSKNSKYVLGIEINKDSYNDALYNKELNNIKNIEFKNLDVEKFIKTNTKHFENVILDPPREGVGKKTIEIIKNEIKPEKIIYMSCNPATQASDFNYLKSDYELKKIVVMDMFPQTYHIETIIVLSKR